MAPPIVFDPARCDGCGICVRLCPTNVFEIHNGKAVVARGHACFSCDLCAERCPQRVIAVRAPAAPETSDEAQLRWAGLPTLAAGGPGAGGASPAAGVPPQSASENVMRPDEDVATAPPSPRLDVLAPALVVPSGKPSAACEDGPARSASLNHKVFSAFPELCIGCKACERACAMAHVGTEDERQARIRVVRPEGNGAPFPIICQHCKVAKCEQACPTKALYYDPKLRDIVMLNEDRCVRCMECVHACPFGAIRVSPAGQILKCDLCNGDPACVKVCPERPSLRPAHWKGERFSCLQYLEPDQVTLLRRLRTMPVPRT